MPPPSLMSYILRMLPCELPKLLSRSYSLVILSSSLVDSTPKTSLWVRTPRPVVHISYWNWICRHRPYTSQASLNTEFVHISFGNWNPHSSITSLNNCICPWFQIEPPNFSSCRTSSLKSHVHSRGTLGWWFKERRLSQASRLLDVSSSP